MYNLKPSDKMRQSQTTTAKYNRQERVYFSLLIATIIIISYVVCSILETI